MRSVLSCLGLLTVSTLLIAEDANHKKGTSKDAAVTSTVQKSTPIKQAKPVDQAEKVSHFKAFTGKVVGNSVRLRLSSELDSPIIKELAKGDLLVVSGEKNEFYAVEPLLDMHAYIFRSLVLDGVIEGNRVNVRLLPDLESPIVGHLSAGDKVEGKICEKQPKWLEITVPNKTRFYVAKEYVDYAGGPELKAIRDRKKIELSKHIEKTENFTQIEMVKPFNEIDFDKVAHNYQLVSQEYKEFPEAVEKAKSKLVEMQDLYLQKKLAYLESKANQISKEIARKEQKGVEVTSKAKALPQRELTMASTASEIIQQQQTESKAALPPIANPSWEPIEENLYLSWAMSHRNKSIEDFYQDQKVRSFKVSGVLETYVDPVRNKPGDFIIRDRDCPVGYAYSTLVDLKPLIGKPVTFHVISRSNNHFAFPAYFVLSVE
ncbi:MAG: hypothetical protein FJZ62_05280 [Chlamydiae bacterium]|nr:hypothetical protein [Chlamydiota bacterium]